MAERGCQSADGDSRVRLPRKCRINSYDTVKDKRRARVKKVADILKKQEPDLTAEESDILTQHPDIVQLAKKNAKIRKNRKERVLETEDPPDTLQAKCESLANAIKRSRSVVVYTGAGISTAASIPDYRGPNGVWTLLRKGKELRAQDLSDAEPTLTHMSITKLYRLGHVKHVVSQNCDGLHLRSGFPRRALSEVHGNMYIEKCHSCRPHKEYIRLFDVTEKTGVRRHGTGRHCSRCGAELRDTIVHFGEKGGLKAPYRWKEAVKAANSADIILCLGSSLKVLRKYTCLWCMDKRPQNRPSLYVVNLQWTPKDDSAILKINGRCDDVMKLVMHHLGVLIPPYNRETDPIFRFSTPLRVKEHNTTSKKILEVPEVLKMKWEHCKKLKTETKIKDELEESPEAKRPPSQMVSVKTEIDPSVSRSIPETAPVTCHRDSMMLSSLPAGAVPVASVPVVLPAGGLMPVWSAGSLLMGPSGLVYLSPLVSSVSLSSLGVTPLPSTILPQVAPNAMEVTQHASPLTPQLAAEVAGQGEDASDVPPPQVLQDHCYCRRRVHGGGSVHCPSVGHLLAASALPPGSSGAGVCLSSGNGTAQTQPVCDSSAASGSSQGCSSIQTASSSNPGGSQSPEATSEQSICDNGTAAATRNPSNDSCEDEAEESTEAYKESKRRTSVPGWFGKGLTIKKRRKF